MQLGKYRDFKKAYSAGKPDSGVLFNTDSGELPNPDSGVLLNPNSGVLLIHSDYRLSGSNQDPLN